MTTAGRQNLYNINNAGSLSAGQRAALASSSNIQLAQAAMNIYDKQQEMNNALAKDYATALMGYGQDEASRMQQANAIQQENYAKAVGAKQRLQAQARKNWYTLDRQNLQDFNTWLNTQGMLDLWDRQVAADETKAGIKRPTTTTSTKDNGSRSLYKANKKLAKKMGKTLNGISLANVAEPQGTLSKQAANKIADQIRQDNLNYNIRKYKDAARDPKYTYFPYRVDLGRGINGYMPSDLGRYINQNQDPARWLYMDAPEGVNPYGWRVNQFRDALKGYIK